MGRKAKERSFAVSGQPASKAEALDPTKTHKEFLSILNYQRKQRNNLLGSFDGDKYVISESIISELLTIPKKFEKFDNNLAYASTVLGDFVLNFKVEMDIQSDYCTAKLFIIEIEQGVEEDIKHTTQLDDAIAIYSPLFRDSCFERWKIYYDEEIYDKNDLLEKYLRLQKEEFLFNRDITEVLSQLYVLRMLQLLDTLGEEGAKAKFEYKLLVEKYLQKYPDFNSNYTMQKILLDSVMQKNKTFDVVLKTEEGKKIMEGYSTPLKNIRDKTFPNLLESKEEKKEKKEEKAKAPAAPAKKKGGKASKPKEIKAFKLDYSKIFPKAKKKDDKKKDDKKKTPPVLLRPAKNTAAGKYEKVEEKREDREKPAIDQTALSELDSLFVKAGISDKATKISNQEKSIETDFVGELGVEIEEFSAEKGVESETILENMDLKNKVQEETRDVPERVTGEQVKMQEKKAKKQNKFEIQNEMEITK